MSHTNGNGKLLKFPQRFLWGTATSPTQVEGHIDNEWTDFVARDGLTCAIACDHYHRYAEDVEWMQRIGVNAYRMGIEWSRLQSDARAPLNQKELARYIDLLDKLTAAGIEPMVVLHHFSNPPWVNAVGGWTNPATVPAFVDFVTRLVAALRGHVRLWNTFNEPDTYACCGYLIGEFPPLRKGRVDLFREVVRNTADAHGKSCEVIRAAGSALGPVEVGFSKNWTFFEPYHRRSPWDNAIANFSHQQLNRYVLERFTGGAGATAATFLGVNYYGRIRFRHLQPLVPTFGFSHAELARLGVHCDDMLERHPSGLDSALRDLYAECRLPIYLTEHGSSSLDEAFRERDLRENLAAMHRAITAGVDVRGFYYWSLLDNFEWQFGYSKKFGLVGIDFSDAQLPRRMKPLGEIYRRVCQENAFEYTASPHGAKAHSQST
jgi:beta-glucosidase